MLAINSALVLLFRQQERHLAYESLLQKYCLLGTRHNSRDVLVLAAAAAAVLVLLMFEMIQIV